MDINDSPLTPDEYEKLFKALELVAQNIERLVNQGITMTEGMDSQEIQSSQKRIETFRSRMEKERQRIHRIRDYARHRNEVNRKKK